MTSKDQTYVHRGRQAAKREVRTTDDADVDVMWLAVAWSIRPPVGPSDSPPAGPCFGRLFYLSIDLSPGRRACAGGSRPSDCACFFVATGRGVTKRGRPKKKSHAEFAVNTSRQRQKRTDELNKSTLPLAALSKKRKRSEREKQADPASRVQEYRFGLDTTIKSSSSDADLDLLRSEG